MRLIYIVACSKEKNQHEAPAKDLYISKRFKLARESAEVYADRWFILSTRYGLLEPDRVIAPYDQFLRDIDEFAREQWSRTVQQKLEPFLDKQTRVVCLGDEEYFREISDWLVKRQTPVYVPFRHLPKGTELLWLQQIQPTSQRARDVARLYAMLKDPHLREIQLRRFGECSGSSGWPQRGVYLFYQYEYNRMLCVTEPKIMRIGTHGVSKGSSSSLWQRLKNHKGKEDLSGNHRGSIFRLHVGAALIKREGLCCPSWGIGQYATDEIEALETDVEKKVSEYIRDMMVLCLRIEDPPSKTSDRAYIEQNMIALLSGPFVPVDIAQESWLGYYCPNPAVRRSSLWNVDYTDMEYDPSFFEVLQTYVDVSAGRITHPEHSLAPMYWYENKKTGYRQKALNFG